VAEHITTCEEKISEISQKWTDLVSCNSTTTEEFKAYTKEKEARVKCLKDQKSAMEKRLEELRHPKEVKTPNASFLSFSLTSSLPSLSSFWSSTKPAESAETDSKN
jgi:hypothetical protein